MPVLILRRPVFTALDHQDRVLESGLFLGEPAIYSDGVAEWAIFSDSRYQLDDIALFGAARTPRPPVRAADIAFPEEDDNPWQIVLDAQNTPATIRMGTSIPDGWTPVSDE